MKWLTDRFMPLYDVPGDPGGGGGVVDTSAAAPDATPAEPSVVEIPGDDALVKFPGSDKPLKAKDIRNFQSQWTREAQKRAEVERKLQEREAQIQRFEQERRQAAQRQSQGQSQDVYEALRQLPYLDGETAVGIVQGIARDIQTRDQVLIQMARQMQAMQQRLGGMYDTHTSSAFDAKIGRWLTEGGYPQEYGDLAKEIYLAYEGDDLDTEFPQIFAARVEQLERAFEAKRQQKLAKARSNVFVPGKGGQATPSKPIQFKGSESSKEIADALFATFAESGT
jgi:hypothetical protein